MDNYLDRHLGYLYMGLQSYQQERNGLSNKDLMHMEL